jgi:hypothetical protein
MRPMRSRPLLILASCFASLTSFAQSSQAKPKLAVLGLEVTGESATDKKATEAAKSLTRALRTEANRSSGPLELAPNSNKDLLEMKLLSDCSEEGRRCMVDIAKQLKAERLLYGRLERTRRGYAVSLRLLDTSSGDILKEESEVIPYTDSASSDLLQRRARSLYSRLTGAEDGGVLAITATAESGTVYVDGQIRTSLSAGSARISGLSSGVHAVAIEARGFERFEAEVDIDTGEVRSLRADMIEAVQGGEEIGGEEEDRPGSGWRVAFWSGVIATGVAGAGWTYSGLTVQGSENDVEAITDDYKTGPTLRGDRVNGRYEDACFSFRDPEVDDLDNATVRSVRDLCDRGDRHEKLVNFVWIPATAAAALFAGFAYYKGYIAPKRGSVERSARRNGKRSRVSVTPALGPNLVGAGLELTF